MAGSIPGLGEGSQLRQNSAVRQIAQDLKINYAPLDSPVFTTPNLGVATATSINGLTITTTTGTLTIAAGKTLTWSNTITIAGTDGSTLNVGTGGTLGSLAFLSAAPAGTLTGNTLAAGVVTSSLTAVGTIATGTWQGTAVGVAYGGTGLTTLTANNVILGNGTSAVQFVAPGTSGNVLTSNGTTWTSTAPTGQWTLLTKAADQSTTSASFADDNTLQFAVSANTTYVFRGVVSVDAGAGGFRIAINGPTAPTEARVNSGTSTTITAYDSSFATSAGSGVFQFSFQGKLENGANSGTLAIRIRQDSASGTTTFEKGSWLEYRAI